MTRIGLILGILFNEYVTIVITQKDRRLSIAIYNAFYKYK